ncbi:MAG: hypothetical protein KJ950_00020 [Proteobacteria bacterium]|nr:hypothetical protein [Pseudomonadota bacterium]MBU1687385.1 hypothetical protein [Pseudomonadota bacterium]
MLQDRTGQGRELHEVFGLLRISHHKVRAKIGIKGDAPPVEAVDHIEEADHIHHIAHRDKGRQRAGEDDPEELGEFLFRFIPLIDLGHGPGEEQLLGGGVGLGLGQDCLLGREPHHCQVSDDEGIGLLDDLPGHVQLQGQAEILTHR